MQLRLSSIVAFVLFVACYNARAVIRLIQNRPKTIETNVYWFGALAGMDIQLENRIWGFFELLFKVVV